MAKGLNKDVNSELPRISTKSHLGTSLSPIITNPNNTLIKSTPNVFIILIKSSYLFIKKDTFLEELRVKLTKTI